MGRIQIGNRDLEILEFLLDMKFATISEIHQKFFRKLKDGKISESEYYTRDRMRALWREGFVESVRFRYTDRKYYIATTEAYHLLENCLDRPHSSAQPIRQIDIRTFEHDALLMKLRLHLEERGEVANWRSDRTIRRQIWLDTPMFRDHIPDALYVDHNQDLVAFELELTMKSKKRYADKLRRYADIVSDRCKDVPLRFQRARFICATEAILRSMKEQAKWYVRGENPTITFELLSETLNAPDKDVKLPQYGLLNKRYDIFARL